MLKELTAAQKGLMVFFLAAILGGAGMRLYYSSDAYGKSLLRNSALTTSNKPETKLLAVDVDGAVKRPGVYRLTAGATRMDAAREAGGLVDADTSGVNLAEKVSDGEKIYIPAKGELQGGSEAGDDVNAAEPGDDAGGAAVDAAAADGGGSVVQKAAAAPRAVRARAEKKTPKVVNLNTASSADLETLPGVGPSTAKKIIELRKLRGPFRAIEEVMLVKGIGVKKFEKMKIYLRVK